MRANVLNIVIRKKNSLTYFECSKHKDKNLESFLCNPP